MNITWKLIWELIKIRFTRSDRAADLDPESKAMKQAIQGACTHLKSSARNFDIQPFEELLLDGYHHQRLLYHILHSEYNTIHQYLVDTIGEYYANSQDVSQIMRNFIIHLKSETLKYPVLSKKIEHYQRLKLIDKTDKQLEMANAQLDMVYEQRQAVEDIFNVLNEVQIYRPFFRSNEQISNLRDENLRHELEKAISSLNIDNVDMGLFQFAVILENVIREYLSALKDGVSTPIVTDDDLRNFSRMINWAERNRVIADKSILHFLREQRNLRAHGRIPDEKVREELMRLAPHLGGLYLEYTFLFIKKREDFLSESING